MCTNNFFLSPMMVKKNITASLMLKFCFSIRLNLFMSENCAHVKIMHRVSFLNGITFFQNKMVKNVII